jgi:hypothetical protein
VGDVRRELAFYFVVPPSLAGRSVSFNLREVAAEKMEEMWATYDVSWFLPC